MLLPVLVTDVSLNQYTYSIVYFIKEIQTIRPNTPHLQAHKEIREIKLGISTTQVHALIFCLF